MAHICRACHRTDFFGPVNRERDIMYEGYIPASWIVSKSWAFVGAAVEHRRDTVDCQRLSGVSKDWTCAGLILTSISIAI